MNKKRKIHANKEQDEKNEEEEATEGERNDGNADDKKAGGEDAETEEGEEQEDHITVDIVDPFEVEDINDIGNGEKLWSQLQPRDPWAGQGHNRCGPQDLHLGSGGPRRDPSHAARKNLSPLSPLPM